MIELAKDRDRIRVLITLNKHPQRAISDRVRGIHGLRLELAQGRYRKVAERAALTGESMEEAHKEIDDIERRIAADIHDALEAELRPMFDRFAAKLQGLGAMDVRTFEHFSAISADIPSSAMDVLAADPMTEMIRRADKQLSMQIQQSVPAIGTTTFWSNNLRGNGQTVAVLDSGATPAHPAFGGRVIALPGVGFNTSFCTIPGDATTPIDFVGHGTHVAGTIMSQGVAGLFLGVAPGLSTLVSIKVGCANGGSPFLTKFDMIAGLNAALGYRHAKVVNVSMGDQVNTDDDHTARQFDDAVDSLEGVVVVAAGNYDPRTPASRFVASPAIGYNVLSVANADTRGSVPVINPESAWGPTIADRRKPDIAAPGTQIYSTNFNYLAGQLFVANTGTSMAAPHVAGAAALLRQRGVTDPKAIKAILINTADRLTWDRFWGWGLINLDAAYRESTSSHYISSSLTSRFGPTPFRLYRNTSPVPELRPNRRSRALHELPQSRNSDSRHHRHHPMHSNQLR